LRKGGEKRKQTGSVIICKYSCIRAYANLSDHWMDAEHISSTLPYANENAKQDRQTRTLRQAFSQPVQKNTALTTREPNRRRERTSDKRGFILPCNSNLPNRFSRSPSVQICARLDSARLSHGQSTGRLSLR